jgi:L-alanine-DL-glutamate epimerase-like enolase superfamily enzyme
VRIVGFDLAMLRIPLRTPFRTALRTVEAVEDVVLALRTDTGHTGYGSAPATPQITGDTHASIIAALRDPIGAALLGGDTQDLPALLARVQGALPGCVSGKCAADVALHDLAGQAAGKPLFRLLGGIETELRTDLTISIDAVPKMLDDIEDALGRGFQALKIKLGKDAAEDVTRVRAIAAAVGTRATLRLDANQGWSAAQAVAVMQALEEAGVHAELLEQPVPASDLEGLAAVARAIRTPVMADEAAFDVAQVEAIARRHAADIVNIKLIKSAGLGGAHAIADAARRHRLRAMMGCMLEGPIGVAAAAHFASACADVVDRVDLDGPSLCAYDPVRSNVTFDGPRIHLGEGPGLGILSIEGLEPIHA